jgi:cobalt-zinc-cadmium efflux system membrane fusion protein
MRSEQGDEKPFDKSGEDQTTSNLENTTPASMADAHATPRKMGFGQRTVVALLLTVVLLPPAAGFYSYFTGVPLHLLASNKDEEKVKEGAKDSGRTGLSLVPTKAHTVEVPEDVSVTLGIHKPRGDSIAVARRPSMTRPLVFPGSTALDPTRLARIRARFAPARVVELGKTWDRAKTGRTEFRERRPGDFVSKGDILGVFYSVDVGSKKNDLLDALVQLELDQKILDRVEANRSSVPEVYYLTQIRAVQGDRNALNRALNSLKVWDIPQEEIDELHAEAKKIAIDRDAWLKTPEGRWVNREKQPVGKKADHSGTTDENPWGRVTLRAPFDGIVVERNLHAGEVVVDNTVNLFQIADVRRMLIEANCPEDELPILESLDRGERRWTVQTVSAQAGNGLPGTIDEVGYLIDPNQHTAVIKGYIDNPGKRIRGGQYVTATVAIPPPDGVVEIPTDSLVDDGLQALVFVQPDPAMPRFAMRRVQVTHRFDHTVFVRSTPIPEAERLTPQEAEAGLLPREPLQAGERVLVSGAVELKAALTELESRPASTPKVRKG